MCRLKIYDTHIHTHTVYGRSFMSDLGEEIVPPYMIGSKEAVKEKMSPVWTKKKGLPELTESYRTFMANVRQLATPHS